MATATPETLGTVVGQIVAEAQRQAANESQKLSDILDRVGDLADEVTQLPEDILQQLKDAVDPPQWWSLLVFALTAIAKADPEHLKVGAMQPPGWSRMVTLTYVNPPVPAVTLGLALVKDIAGGVDLQRGVLLRVDDKIDPAVRVPAHGGPYWLSLAASGAIDWLIPFGQPLTAPLQVATIDASVNWDPPDLGSATAGVLTGPAQVAVHLDTAPGNELYSLKVGLGAAATPGLRIALNLAPTLGALAGFVSIAAIDERYSPQYARGQKTAGAFHLNHTSSA
jgi:hypothetical protein